MNELVLALTKGRVLSGQLALLEKIGITPDDDLSKSRKLVFSTSRANVKLMVLRGMDVATYVQHGIADAGMSGKDVLLEHGAQGYYEPLDLGLGKCQLMEAGFESEGELPRRLRIATKFPTTAKRFYAMQGRQVDIIKLYGAMELAPISGLAHRIVDIVETGNTLRANGLVPMTLIEEISTRLIVNEVSQKTKHPEVKALIDDLAKACDDASNE